MEQANISRALECVRGFIGDPHAGLPEEVFEFISGITPLVNVDLLVRDALGRTLLTWREDRYYPPGWHVPGGIVRFRETFDDRIHAVAMSELDAEISQAEGPIAVNQIIHPSRDVRGHFISLLFRCTLKSGPSPANIWREDMRPEAGQWAWHRACPHNLISVHEMYRPFM